ncbi:MAG TPA: hypothetical protein PLD59_12135, partial [Tepidisphaeraceae bacterium]|nr:hypothetical protein [Tepidisphaeraceae bacterium]
GEVFSEVGEKEMLRKTLGAIAAAAAMAVASTSFAAVVTDVTFQEGAHGEVITTKFLAQYGFTVTANNLTPGRPDKAIIFNTRERNTADPDLEGWNSFLAANAANKQWTRGNLKGKNDLGKILIIAENDTDADNNGLVDRPNDEGNRPAGSITFNFRTPITEIAFNLVDVEGPSEFSGNSGFVATFHGVNSARTPVTTQVGFGQFVTPGNQFHDSTVVFGDNSANAIKPILASQVGLMEFSTVVFDLGGSGGIDRLRYRFTDIPEPMTLGMLSAFAPVALRRRRA